MAGHRSKRQFVGAASDSSQRQITSFFSTAASGHATPVTTKPAVLNGPDLPHQVQTDLLAVGMRVRKAVPEGYKTDSKFGAFTLWAEDSTTTTGISASTASSGTYSSTMRELEPFCGINKVGGLAFQPSHNAIDDAIDYTTMPSLTNSQDSVFSTSFSSSTFVPAISANIPTNTTTPAGTFTTTLPTRKRSFLPEEDEVVRDNLSTSLPYRGSVRLSTEQQREGWLDGEVSPRTLALPAEMWENSRVLAVPRRARQHRKTGGDEGEENVMIAVLGQDGNDFEEASFLDYNGVVEEDAEMAG